MSKRGVDDHSERVELMLVHHGLDSIVELLQARQIAALGRDVGAINDEMAILCGHEFLSEAGFRPYSGDPRTLRPLASAVPAVFGCGSGVTELVGLAASAVRASSVCWVRDFVDAVSLTASEVHPRIGR